MEVAKMDRHPFILADDMYVDVLHSILTDIEKRVELYKMSEKMLIATMNVQLLDLGLRLINVNSYADWKRKFIEGDMRFIEKAPHGAAWIGRILMLRQESIENLHELLEHSFSPAQVNKWKWLLCQRDRSLMIHKEVKHSGKIEKESTTVHTIKLEYNPDDIPVEIITSEQEMEDRYDDFELLETEEETE